MKIYIFLFTLLVVGASCNSPATNPNNERVMFNAAGLKVIASYANRKQHIMATLYGNDAALQAALNGNKSHTTGEVFTLVTWSQANNKYWYGSYINGNLKSVESVKILPATNGNSKIAYQLVKGHTPKNIDGNVPNRQDRINLIFAQRPSVFP